MEIDKNKLKSKEDWLFLTYLAQLCMIISMLIKKHKAKQWMCKNNADMKIANKSLFLQLATTTNSKMLLALIIHRTPNPYL